MADERHLPASDRKRQKARDEGDIARSRDVMSFLPLVVVTIGLAFVGSSIATGATKILRELWVGLPQGLASASAAPWSDVALPTLGLLCLSPLAMVAAGFAQGGGTLPVRSLRFEWDKFNVVKRLQQLFFSTESAVNVITALFKVVVLATACALAVRVRLADLLLGGVDVPGFGPETNFAVTLLFFSGAAFGLLAAADFAIQFMRHEKKLRMTVQEAKDENKDESGDPFFRSQRKRKHQSMVADMAIQKVPEADVVITNPTHYAVAVRYERGRDQAPIVIAKGVDQHGQRIRLAASRARVPILSRPPLARALYKKVKVGREVPPALYRAVAVVLAEVYRIRRRYVA